MAKSAAREAEQPVTLEEIRNHITQLDTLIEEYVSQFPSALAGKTYLTDVSFAKAQNTLTYLNTRPELFTGVDRKGMGDRIQQFLAFQNLIQGFDPPIKRLENARKRQSQDLHALVLGIYDAAKSAVKTGITADPKLVQPLVDDLSEIFEKSAETRRKNFAKKKKMEEEAQKNTPVV